MNQTAEPGESRILKIASIVMLAFDLLILIVPLFMAFLYVPRLQLMFKEMDLALPPLTRLLVLAPRFVYLAVFGLFAAGMIAKEFLIKRVKVNLIANGAALFVAWVFVVFVIVALFLPLHVLINTIGAASPTPTP